MRHHKHQRHGSPRRFHDQANEAFAERRFAHGPLDAGYQTGGRHRAPGGHRGGGRRRLFDHGDLRFILLSMIETKPAHGYDLIKALEDRMGGGYSPSPGVIYPTLTMLEEQGLTAGATEDGRKLYRATADGAAFLQTNRATLDAIQARIDSVAREHGAVPDPRIVRAIENLKTALRLRIADGAIPDDQVRQIAAAIDAAAATAERR